MTTRFTILASARTGTNRLVAQLCAQPDVWCHGEVLKRGKVPVKRATGEQKAQLLELRERDFDAFLGSIFALSNDRPLCGIKVLLGHLNDRIEPSILDDTSLLKIVLFRPNVLAVHASALAARESDAWNPVQMARTERPLVRFGPKAFKVFHEKYRQRYGAISDRLAASGQKHFFLQTHELNEASRIAELLAFLGAETDVVEPEVPSSRGPSDILSRFSNPEVAQRYLRENDLMHWAHEGPQS